MDRDVVFEGISHILGVSAKPVSAFQAMYPGKTAPVSDLLSVQDFLLGSVLGGNVVSQLLSLLVRGSLSGPLLAIGGGSSAIEKEIFVNESEFFDQKFDYDFTRESGNEIFSRGNERYNRPYGWNRIALKVLDKYPDGNTWLGTDGLRTNSVVGEWPVSYHGTSMDGAKSIIQSHYKPGNGQAYGRGIYSTPDINVAEQDYAKTFTSIKTRKTYKVILQNRINPIYRVKCTKSDYWLVPLPEGTAAAIEKAIVTNTIRPYGLLLKEE